MNYVIRKHNAKYDNKIIKVIMRLVQLFKPNMSNISFEEMASVSYLEIEVMFIFTYFGGVQKEAYL